MAQKSLPKEELKLPTPESESQLPGTAQPRSRSILRFPILAILFLVVIILLSSGYLLLRNNARENIFSPNRAQTNQAVETANWNTYTNNTKAFSIKYPPGWKVIERHSNPDTDQKDPDTVVFQNGFDNEVVVWWNGVGLGGPCEKKDNIKIQLKESLVDGCKYLVSVPFDFLGNTLSGEHIYWDQIYATNIRSSAHEAAAAISKNDQESIQTVEKILSTLDFSP